MDDPKRSDAGPREDETAFFRDKYKGPFVSFVGSGTVDGFADSSLGVAEELPRQGRLRRLRWLGFSRPEAHQ